MDQFSTRQNLPKLTQKIDKMSICISITEIEFIVASLPTKKIPGSDGITDGFYQTFKKKVISILHKLFQKTEEGRALPNIL